MAQLFKPSTNTLARLGVMLAAGAPVIAILVGMQISRGSSNTKVGQAHDQPIPFSHEHHVSELGIDCRYCHTSVEESAKAGMPSSDTCMTCHSQIWTNSPLLEPLRQSYAKNQPLKWVQLNKTPEFVYFNHAVHVNKGISCNHCHGAIQKMQMAYKARTLFMAWCLECHKEPEKYLYTDKTSGTVSPREQVFNLYKKYQVDPRMQGAPDVEKRLASGGEQRNAASAAEGLELLEKRGIRRKALADCSICHR